MLEKGCGGINCIRQDGGSNTAEAESLNVVIKWVHTKGESKKIPMF